MGSSPSEFLSSLQRRVVDLFFESTGGFFLTGGAALAAFHLRHRRTRDLDFFTTDDAAFEGAIRGFTEACRRAGLSVEEKTAAPRFRRYVVSDGKETLPVDLVRDVEYQVRPEKPRQGSIVVDSIEDLLVNKVCAILSRCEVRDVVDLFFLDAEGYRVVDALDGARRKDVGATPENLAFVLSQVEVLGAPRDLVRPVTRDQLEGFVRRLRADLARLALPGENP